MMTLRCSTLSLATSLVLIASMLAPARAGATSAAAKPANSAAKVHIAANLDVPAPRLSKATTATIRAHRRRVATASQQSISAPAGTIRLAYRPAAQTVCGRGVCAAPIVLFIGITY